MHLSTEAGRLKGAAVKHSRSYGVKVESGIILAPTASIYCILSISGLLPTQVQIELLLQTME